jgi:tRNA nucleotidyltransferase (CCA-adding enzyme)
MRIVVGHANPDFDAYASMVAATKLYPGSKAVFLGTQNTNVRAFHNLHEEFLEFVELKGLDLDAIDSVVMVDTRDPDRIGEIAEVVRRPGVEVIVYDHHREQEGDIEGAEERIMDVGSTTAILVHELKQRQIDLAPLEASVMLLGIHEDTGSLTYPGVTAYDADAAAYLMASGADLEVLNRFLQRTLDADQQKLLGQLQDSLETWVVNGQQIAVGTASADEYVDSASVLTHYVVEDMGYRVAIAVVSMPERVQVVARSRLAEVDVGAVMAHLGGGGHAQAASAGFRAVDTAELLRRLRLALEAEVRTPLRAREVMTAPVRTVGPEVTMAEAGELMARWGHGGLPVVEDGQVVGLVTRKDVDKAVRHGLDHAPVKGFMGRDIFTVGPDIEVEELERLLASRGIGRVPVIDDGVLAGIVTRKDVLRAEHGDAYLDKRLPRGHPQATERFLGNMAALLPEDVFEAIASFGKVAADKGMQAHLVGGFVRDMLLGRHNLDIDVVVEGDGIALAEEAAAQLGARLKVHRRFGTAVLVFSRDFHVDVASSRSEFYTKPGALPTVERSSLRQDLLRRDFTINAMAACIDPERFGQIADPFGGLNDLEVGKVRVLHSLSFADDPTRVLRAARFEVRYGFSMDRSTEELARRAIAMGVLEEVSGARIREELLDILNEEKPLEVLRRLDGIGALARLMPDARDTSEVLDLVGQLEAGVAAVTGPVFRPRLDRAIVATLAGAGPRRGCERWLRHYRFGREYSDVALASCARGAGALRALQDGRGMRNSRLYRVLAPLPPEALVVLWARADDTGRERIEKYVGELARVRMAVSGEDLIGMGFEPSPAFASILARALDDRLDEKAVGRDQELANLRRIAQHAAGAAREGKIEA